MPRRTQTYGIRLAVEGGGRVKAELVSVGQSGRPERHSMRAFRGKGSRGNAFAARERAGSPKPKL